jgi:hypothetical protein
VEFLKKAVFKHPSTRIHEASPGPDIGVDIVGLVIIE